MFIGAARVAPHGSEKELPWKQAMSESEPKRINWTQEIRRAKRQLAEAAALSGVPKLYRPALRLGRSLSTQLTVKAIKALRASEQMHTGSASARKRRRATGQNRGRLITWGAAN